VKKATRHKTYPCGCCFTVDPRWLATSSTMYIVTKVREASLKTKMYQSRYSCTVAPTVTANSSTMSSLGLHDNWREQEELPSLGYCKGSLHFVWLLFYGAQCVIELGVTCHLGDLVDIILFRECVRSTLVSLMHISQSRVTDYVIFLIILCNIIFGWWSLINHNLPKICMFKLNF
jgi:hypothetical protein